jgi:3',5'-cyclic-AMP phosphodiesterase
MTRPFLIAQLTDPHIGADWGGTDPEARLAAAVDSVLAMRPSPDVVLLTGDLVDHGADTEYERLRELLAPLKAPLHPLAGNHDDRSALRSNFDLASGDGDPVQYAVDLGPVRLVALDSTRPGHDDGELDPQRLAWLDAELAAAPDAPTLLAVHHPPMSIGIPAWDELGLAPDDRRALGEVVARHRQVRRIVAGHVHRAISGELAGRAVLSVPSTFVQARLDFDSDEIALVPEPAGFAVHAVVDGELISHIQPVS